MTHFGNYIRVRREELQAEHGRTYSLRQVATRVDVEPSYLSKLERSTAGFESASEDLIRKLAAELTEDADMLLALAGKVSADLQQIIIARPKLFAELLRQLKQAPDHAILHVVREVKDGSW